MTSKPSYAVAQSCSRRIVDRDGNYTFEKPIPQQEIIRLALDILGRSLKRESALSSPEMTRHYLRLALAQEEHEVFAVLFLDNRHRVISFDRMFNGTIDGASVYPREVVKAALKHNAAAVIFAHNHPSGVAEPSPADRAITQRLRDALSLVDVRTLDHIVVCAGESVSFAERGLL